MRVLRFAAPLAVVAALALAPVWLLALAAHAPATPDDLASTDHLIWLMVACAIYGQLALVGGATAMHDAPSQLAALRRGVVGVGRAVVPCALAAIAVVVGTLALVVPGVLALAMFATTGAAAQQLGPSAEALGRAAAAARGRLRVVAALALGMVAADVLIAVVAHHVFLVLPAKPTPHDLAAAVTYVRVVALALVAVSPLAAAALADRYARNRAR